MRRLNFLDDEPWDEVSDGARVRWFARTRRSFQGRPFSPWPCLTASGTHPLS
jgi:hypothetical protein